MANNRAIGIADNGDIGDFLVKGEILEDGASTGTTADGQTAWASPTDVMNTLGLGPRIVATGGTTDDTTTVAAQALEAEGGTLVFLSGVTYTLAYSTSAGVLIPSGTTVEVQHGATIIGKASSATGAGIYHLIGFVDEDPTDITFTGGGTIDGNRENGNGGSTENCAGILGSDIVGFTVDGITFQNFRSEGVYIGHTDGGTLPKRLTIRNCTFDDCGYPKTGGSNTTTRQGMAITGGQDITITGNTFDTVKGYAIDLEGVRSGDTFDNVHISGNTFRACEQGFVNVTGTDTISNLDVRDNVANGLNTTANTFVIPTANKRRQIVTRTAGDLTLTPGDTSWHDVGTISDITLKGCRPGDLVEVSLSSAWDSAATFRNLDVASIVSSSPVNYWGTNDGTPVNGVSAWRGFSGTARPFGGSVVRRIVAGDLATDGTLTLRFRYKLNSATSTVLTASAPALQAHAINHGPY